MTRCRRCGSTILVGNLQQCRCIGKSRMVSVSSFVRSHQNTHLPQSTPSRLMRLWRRLWPNAGLPLVLIGWGCFFALRGTAIGYGGMTLVLNPLFLAIALAVGVGLPICSRDSRRGSRLRGIVGTLLGYALGAAATLMLFLRILNPEAWLKL